MRGLQEEWLEKYQGVPFSAADLKTDLTDYSTVSMKLSRLVVQGVLLRLKKGFYCLAPDCSEKLIEPGVVSIALYGPSDVSFDSALPLDVTHLVERAKESEPGADVSTPEKVVAAFDAKIESIDFDGAKLDVEPYLKDKSELDIWSRDFFHQMVRKMIFTDSGMR